MADGKSNLKVLGETNLELHRDHKIYKLNALVCDMPEDTILAGMPFLHENDIAIRPATAEIIIDGEHVIKYDPKSKVPSQSYRLSSYVVVNPSHDIILPGESVQLPLPLHLSSLESVAVEPRLENCHNRNHKKAWPVPQVIPVADGKLSLINNSPDVIQLKKNEHVSNIQPPVPEETSIYS